MNPSVRDHLVKARDCLSAAKKIIELPIPEVAAKEAYLAASMLRRHLFSPALGRSRRHMPECERFLLGLLRLNPASKLILRDYSRDHTNSRKSAITAWVPSPRSALPMQKP